MTAQFDALDTADDVPVQPSVSIASTSATARLARFDGRTRVLAVRDAEDWKAVARLRWTRPLLTLLRTSGVREVVLARGMRRGRMPLTWIPEDVAP